MWVDSTVDHRNRDAFALADALRIGDLEIGEMPLPVTNRIGTRG
jgi:hypothetical protein